MTKDSHDFATLAAKLAKSPEVRKFFELLVDRSVTLTGLRESMEQTILRNRETREGKPSHFTRKQRKTLQNFRKDAESAAEEMRKRIGNHDDQTLLNIALRSETDAFEFESRLYASFHPEDQPSANKITAFRADTIRIIQEFLANRAMQ